MTRPPGNVEQLGQNSPFWLDKGTNEIVGWINGKWVRQPNRTMSFEPLPIDGGRTFLPEGPPALPSRPPQRPKYPAGVQQMLSGRSVARPQSLFRAAGLTVPSAQAWRNLIPSERSTFGELGRLAGIPEADFNQELMSTAPGGGGRRAYFNPYRRRFLR